MIPKIVEVVKGGGGGEGCNFNRTKPEAALLSKVRNPFCELLGYFFMLDVTFVRKDTIWREI